MGGAPMLMLLRAALLVLVLLGVGQAARADEAADALAAIGSGSFSGVREGIERLSHSGSDRALPVIEALHDGSLRVRDDHSLVIETPDGKLLDAATGQPAAPGAPLHTVRVNNPIRSAIDAALGDLQLVSTDRAKRIAAAEAVFVSHDPAALPALDRALAHETDRSVRRRMEQAHAAALLTSSDGSETERLAAIATLRNRGDLAARSLLQGLHNQTPSVADAASRAEAAIGFNLALWNQLEGVYYGLSLGSVLLLAATGLAITFGVMGVINMAHGEMVMIGAYVTYVVQGLVHDLAPAWEPAGLAFAVPAAFTVAGAVGVLIERTLIRYLYGRPLETLLATFGISLILQQAVRSIFGPTNRQVSTPGWMSGALDIGGLTLTYNRLVIILFAILVFAGLMLVLRRSSLGLRMRAVTQNRRMAAAMGIRTPWVDALTFGLGSGVAGMAGVALSQIDNVSPNLGQGYIIDSFMVVVFGGVGNLWGTLVAAMTLGIVNKFLEPVAGAVLGKIVVLVLLILFIQRKPRGMFPLRGRAVEQ